jgi:hypothetical protein
MKKYKNSEEDYKKGLTSRESLLISTLARKNKKIFSKGSPLGHPLKGTCQEKKRLTEIGLEAS